MEKSKKYNLNRWDFIKGLAITMFVASLTAIQGVMLTAIDINEVIEISVRAAISAGIGYLINNYFEDEKGNI